MPWNARNTVSLREEFVRLASQADRNMTQLCKRFGIARNTGYKWLRRFSAAPATALQDRSRRPHLSPEKTSAEMEAAVVAARKEHPAWGGRKLRCVLQREHKSGVPAKSTITDILHRHGLIADHSYLPSTKTAESPFCRPTVLNRPSLRRSKPVLDHRPLSSAPKARNILAQGKALGRSPP